MGESKEDKLLAKYSKALQENAQLRDRCARLAQRNEQLELQLEQYQRQDRREDTRKDRD